MENQSSLLDVWPYYATLTANVLIAFGFIVLVIHYVRFSTTKGYAKKYDYLNRNEAKYLLVGNLSLIIAVSLYLNSAMVNFFSRGGIFELAVGLFISSIIGVAFGYALYAYLKFYYPSILEEKLMKLRFKPRVSPETGNVMKLLTEDEEDIHLTDEMIEHEESLKYEYDVWLDEESGHKFIERYDGHQHAKLCPSCNFRTLKEYKEEEVLAPTQSKAGLGKKFFKCSYCSHHETHEVNIAPLNEEVIILQD
ncbi:MAG: hypothetical protein OEW67_02460 [Cyclobacteriaceae bacterium]|nr:hypothetical protein [Cyclobacteriaceae bacterium]